MKLRIEELLREQNETRVALGLKKINLTDLADLVIAPTKADQKLKPQEVRLKRYRALRRLINGQKKSVDLVTIAKLCTALNASPNQLIDLKPQTQEENGTKKGIARTTG